LMPPPTTSTSHDDGANAAAGEEARGWSVTSRFSCCDRLCSLRFRFCAEETLVVVRS
jgi:hypothetical protein